MFIIDDILLAPAKGFMWIVRELHNAAQQEIEGEADRLTHRLSTLYMLLETGGISTEEFDEQERQILARLDELGGQDATDDEDEDASELVDDELGEDDAEDGEAGEESAS